MNPSDSEKWRVWKNNLLKAMVEARRDWANSIVEEVLASGANPTTIVSELLSPVQIKLGQLWEQQSVSLSQTFVAAKIAEDIFSQCNLDDNPLPSDKGKVVIGNIEDDFHGLGRHMVGVFLRTAGWGVHDLGNDATPEAFIEEAMAIDAAVVGASAMTLTTAMNIKKLRELIDTQRLGDRIKLAVGGAVFIWRPELVAEVGGDGTAQNAAGADGLMTKLSAEVCEGALS